MDLQIGTDSDNAGDSLLVAAVALQTTSTPPASTPVSSTIEASLSAPAREREQSPSRSKFSTIRKGQHANCKPGSPAIHYPSSVGRRDTVQLLPDREADIQTMDKTGWMALRYPARADTPKVVLLLDRGTDIQTIGKAGRSAQHNLEGGAEG